MSNYKFIKTEVKKYENIKSVIVYAQFDHEYSDGTIMRNVPVKLHHGVLGAEPFIHTEGELYAYIKGCLMGGLVEPVSYMPTNEDYNEIVAALVDANLLSFTPTQKQ